jgi:hypothetical protein
LEAFKAAGEPFTKDDMMKRAQEKGIYYSQTFEALSAEDALVMARVNGGDGIRPALVFSIRALGSEVP